MFSNIPVKRLWIYFLLAGLVPVVCAWVYISSKLSATQQLQNQVYHIQEQAYNREKKQALNMSVRHHFHDSDHFYIDKNLETLTFLEPEIDSLKGMSNNPNFPEDENIKKRLELLSGSGNSMRFSEGIVQSTPVFQEVTETLVHPVEVNVTDIQQILCRIEGIPIGNCTPQPHRPQLIILDFKIEKKNVSEKNQVFLLNLKLLKREFL